MSSSIIQQQCKHILLHILLEVLQKYVQNPVKICNIDSYNIQLLTSQFLEHNVQTRGSKTCKMDFLSAQ